VGLYLLSQQSRVGFYLSSVTCGFVPRADKFIMAAACGFLSRAVKLITAVARRFYLMYHLLKYNLCLMITQSDSYAKYDSYTQSGFYL
jgi:hypothetical protein